MQADFASAFEGLDMTVKSATKAVGAYLYWRRILEQRTHGLSEGERMTGIPFIPLPGTLDGLNFTECSLDVTKFLQDGGSRDDVLPGLKMIVTVLQQQAWQAVAAIATHYTAIATMLNELVPANTPGTTAVAPPKRAKRGVTQGVVQETLGDSP